MVIAALAVTAPELAAWTDAVLLSGLSGQFDTVSERGAMKSLISAVKEVEDRLFRYAWPKATHWLALVMLAGKMPAASMLISASPNVNGFRLLGEVCPGARIGSVTEAVFTVPATFAFSAWTWPQHGKRLDAWQTELALWPFADAAVTQM